MNIYSWHNDLIGSVTVQNDVDFNEFNHVVKLSTMTNIVSECYPNWLWITEITLGFEINAGALLSNKT